MFNVKFNNILEMSKVYSYIFDRQPVILHGYIKVTFIVLLLLLLLLLFTAIGFAPGGSSPTLVQTKTMKQHYTLIRTQYNKTYRSNHTVSH
jgi:hypothetical protein